MPWSCFSYPASSGPRRPTTSHCFSYAADLRRMPESGPCFSYPADAPRRMPVAGCFSYSADAPLLAAPGLNRKSFTTCFRY
jgi:hypothetical protein